MSQASPLRGASDRHALAYHEAHSGNNGAILAQLKHSDWKALSQQSSATGTTHSHDVTITNLEKDKQVLADENASTKDRSRAARELLRSGYKEVHVTDKNGVEHVYRLEQEEKDGTTETKVTEKDRVVFDIVEDANGNEIVVPHIQHEAPHTRSANGGGGAGGGRHSMVPERRPRGLSYPGSEPGSVGHYHQPRGGSSYNPAGDYDHHVWQGVKNSDGSVTLNFRGCQVDTDGSGAWRHPEDRCRQSRTSLRLSNGTSLDTDRDNFFVLPPSVAHAYGIHKGDLGWLVQKDTGKAVPVVFGDSGPEGKLGEASVAALKSLGYNVNGRVGVERDRFQVVFVPRSGDGTGDIARQGSEAMAAKLNAIGVASSNVQVG